MYREDFNCTLILTLVYYSVGTTRDVLFNDDFIVTFLNSSCIWRFLMTKWFVLSLVTETQLGLVGFVP